MENRWARTSAVEQAQDGESSEAFSVEEASAAARSMEEQAGTMEKLVQQFRISEQAAHELKRRRQEAADAMAGAGDHNSETNANARQHPDNSFVTKSVSVPKAKNGKAAPSWVNGHNAYDTPTAQAAGSHDDNDQWTSF